MLNRQPKLAIAILFSAMFSTDFGLINAALGLVGIGPVDWLNQPGSLKPVIALVVFWRYLGFNVVLYLAALQTIPKDLYEAATMDGAGRWQQFRFITLPGIRPTLVFTILMITIWSFLVFDYIYQLTQGGPAHASEVLATEVYSAAFARFEVGYAAAIGLSISLICGVVVIGFVILRRRGWEI